MTFLGRLLNPLLKSQRLALPVARLNAMINIRLALRAIESVKKGRVIRGARGINIAGQIASESGVGEAARSSIRAIEAAGIPHVLNNIPGLSRQNDLTYTDFSEGNPYMINLIHVNADGAPDFFLRGPGRFKDRYNIGYWLWELSEFPRQWRDSFRFFDEIWTSSDFCAESISKSSPVPVVKIPLAVEVKGLKNLKRPDFGLEEDKFIFLFVFDFYSYIERKNPLAAVEAFRRAFGGSTRAQLVLKCSNSHWNIRERDRLLEASRGLDVKLIDGYLGKEELHTLVSLCDCYLSLHRSEGFGFTLAEAMYLEKPVIATGYSGNMDFMDDTNSFLVRHSMVKIEKESGPYKKGNVWAEPDASHAAELLRLVYENSDLARKVGRKAAADIKALLCPASVGKMIHARVAEIEGSVAGKLI